MGRKVPGRVVEGNRISSADFPIKRVSGEKKRQSDEKRKLMTKRVIGRKKTQWQFERN